MTKNQGKRRGVPKTPAELHYKRRYFSLPPDVVAWLDGQPSGQRSRIVAEALREKMAVRSSVRSETPGAAENVPKARKSAKK